MEIEHKIIVTQGKYEDGERRKTRVEVTCPSCKNKRLMMQCRFNKLRTGLCLKCSCNKDSGTSKIANSIEEYRARENQVLDTGSKILWNSVVLVSRRGRARVTVECVCGKRVETKAWLATNTKYTGLCKSCGPAYGSWKRHQIKPMRYRDGDKYILTNVDRNSPFSEMANFKSESPFAMGAIPEHRLKIAEKLGRPLINGEIVHHIDNDKANNDIDNLMLVSGIDHIAITRIEGFYKRRIEELEEEVRQLKSNSFI